MKLEELRSHKEAILALAAKYKAQHVRVFGSVARGDAKPQSDIDLLVEFQPDASLLDESNLDIALKKLLKCKVDLLGDDVMRPEFRPFILRDAIPL